MGQSQSQAHGWRAGARASAMVCPCAVCKDIDAACLAASLVGGGAGLGGHRDDDASSAAASDSGDSESGGSERFLRGFNIAVSEATYAIQLEVKARAEQAKFPSVVADVLTSPALGHRMRVKFLLGRGKSGRWAFGTSNTVAGESVVNFCIARAPAASDRINAAMGAVLAALDAQALDGSHCNHVNFMDTAGRGDLIVAFYFLKERLLDAATWRAEAGAAIALLASRVRGRVTLVARRSGQVEVASSDPAHRSASVRETGLFAGAVLLQTEGSFSNPNVAITRKVNDWLGQKLLEHDVKDASLVELCSGCGNHTVGLSRYFRRLLCVEIDQRLVDHARENVRLNGIQDKVTLVCDDMARISRIVRKHAAALEGTTVLLVDPPRRGMDDAAAERAAALGCDFLVYVACGDGLERNMGTIAETYELVDLALADHFAFTHFLEKVALFKKKKEKKSL